MRVMVIVKASNESETGAIPNEALLRDMGNYNEELVKAGVMLAGEGLLESKKGKRVFFSGKKRTVVDGPFTEAKELVAGFWIWKVKDLDEAVEWVKKMPNTGYEHIESHIEIRQIAEMEDFGAEMTPELREQEKRVQEAAEKNR